MRRTAGVGGQRRLGDTHKRRTTDGRTATVLDDVAVDLAEAGVVHQLTRQQVGVAGVDDGHATGHLVHDDLDVLVVDIHTLGAVHGVHFLHDVDLGGALARMVRIFLGSTEPSTSWVPTLMWSPSATLSGTRLETW